jgi:guanylate kinase
LIHTIVTITGASGAGKTTLENALFQHFGGGRVRTMTTRAPREGETAANYDFQTEESLAERADLLWHLPIHNAVYAVALPEFDKAAAETNGLAFVAITPERHEFLVNHFTPKGVRCVAVHLAHPGEKELKRRLEERGEDAPSVVKRLADSVVFEESAMRVAKLNIIHSDTPNEAFQQVLSLIEVTP